MNRYPGAEWVPWKWTVENPSYYYDQNVPEAVVLHVAQGWEGTIRTWAAAGYTGASWHYTVCLDGRVLQHIDHNHGGYHAGIAQLRPDGRPNPPPEWKLWKGWGVNVNRYTIGIEHEGFSGKQMPPAQMAASRGLCRWLAGELNVPLDIDHFTHHGSIALLDRADDFNTAPLRDEYYRFLFETVQPAPPAGDKLLKIRLEPVGEATYHWTDDPAIREQRQLVKIVYDE